MLKFRVNSLSRARYSCSFLLISKPVIADMCGSENWEEMVWGENLSTAPAEAPEIDSTVATED